MHSAAPTESLSANSTSGISGFRSTRWIRLPPFAMAYAVCATVLAVFTVWILLDAQFDSVLYWAAIDTGIRKSSADPAVVAIGFWDDMWGNAHKWSHLGARFTAFFALAFLGVVSFVFVAIRLFVGRVGSGRSLRCWMLVIILIATWLGLWVSYDSLHWRGTQWRVRGQLSRFEAAAKPLVEHWPTLRGDLPEAGEYYAYPVQKPDSLLRPNSGGYSMRENFGFMIERTERGGLRFSLNGAYDCRVEFHPEGASPDSYTDNWGKYQELKDAVRMKESWYLARYR